MSSPPNAQYAPETCQWCKGTGHDDHIPTKPDHPQPYSCAACNGQGRVQVAQPSQPCVHCKGTTVNPDPGERHGKPCDYCGRTGWSLRWIPPPRPS